jgi:hypothetical protein
MKAAVVVVSLLLSVVGFTIPIHAAQHGERGNGNDDPSFTDNLGLTVSLPLHPISFRY